MRRIIGITMAVTGILTIITGIGELAVHPASIPYHHIIISVLFVASAGIHIWLNRKAVGRYFGGLGWRWGLIVGLAIVFFALINFAL